MFGRFLPSFLESLMHSTPQPTRRRFLQDAAGTAVAASLAGAVGAASAKEQDGPSAGPIRALYATLTKEQRTSMCFAWDHIGFTKLPLRLHVTNNWDITRTAISSFTKPQQQL